MPEPEDALRCPLLKGMTRLQSSLIAGIAIATFSQRVPAQPRLQFDVASVKLNKDGVGGSLVRTPAGLTATNAGFDRLVQMAFQTREIDLSHVPEALRTQHFDIVAKAAGKITGDQYWDMLRPLLEDRFHLVHHREARTVPMYALVLAKKEIGLGPNISRSADPTCPSEPTGSNFCGVRAQPRRIVGQRVSMSRIARELTPFAGRPVQDRTGLTGSFDFHLTWTPDEYVSNDGKAKLLNGSPVDTSSPSFFTAVQQQLGLRLAPGKGRVETLVIDHAEFPQPN
jgi:uncharacterized protein (TIGR03435 family)